jgi:hypothetical protein
LPKPPLRRVTLFKAIYVFDGENWRTRAWSKNRYASVEANIGFRYSPQQGFHEVIDFLARLAGQIFEALLKRGIEDNGGGWHSYNL